MIVNVIHPALIILVLFCFLDHHWSDLVSLNCAYYVKETLKKKVCFVVVVIHKS